MRGPQIVWTGNNIRLLRMSGGYLDLLPAGVAGSVKHVNLERNELHYEDQLQVIFHGGLPGARLYATLRLLDPDLGYIDPNDLQEFQALCIMLAGAEDADTRE